MKKQPFNGKIRVLDQLEKLIPPLDAEQLRILEQSLKEEGRAYNPLWLWGDVLVDGHHRYKLCKKLNLPYNVLQVYETAETIEDVEYRMKRDAIGQRNLSPALQSRFRAEMVTYHVSRGKGKQEAVKIVAKESNVSERQVYRDVERAELVEKVDESVKPATDTMSGPALRKLSQLPKPEQQAVAKRAGGDSKKIAKEIEQVKPDPEEAAKKIKNIAHQHRDKLARAICDYNEHKPNLRERDRLVKVVQSVQVWE